MKNLNVNESVKVATILKNESETERMALYIKRIDESEYIVTDEESKDLGLPLFKSYDEAFESLSQVWGDPVWDLELINN